jgi:hypothetical protein
MAFVFLHRFFAPLALLWGMVAVPACLVVYYLVDRFEYDLRLAWIVFFFATGPMGVLLVAGGARASFGESPAWPAVWRSLGWRGVRLLIRSLVLRCATAAGLVFLIVPGLWLAIRYGFMAEQAVLSNMDRHLSDRRTDELIKGELFDLLLRALRIDLFCKLLWLSLFLTLDLGCQFLLGFPILLGRLHVDVEYMGGLVEAIEYLFSFFWNDPRVVTAMLLTAFAVYPFGRLAWYFCYIDLRVRRDCWDMELQILQEAERLDGSVSAS